MGARQFADVIAFGRDGPEQVELWPQQPVSRALVAINEALRGE